MIPAVGTPEYRAWRKSAAVAKAEPPTPSRPVVSPARERQRVTIANVAMAKAAAEVGQHIVGRIIREVAEKHGIEMRDIVGQCRLLNVTAARQEVYFRARTETRLSFASIGKRIGGRDHSTIVHGMCEYLRKKGLTHG